MGGKADNAERERLLRDVEAELARAEEMLAKLEEHIAQCRDWVARSELAREEAIRLRDALQAAVEKMKDSGD